MPTLPLPPASSQLWLDPTTGTLRSRVYSVEVLTGPEAGKTLTFEDRLTVGSHESSGLVLSDPTVSRFHVELEAAPDGVRVRDLQSRNGTFVRDVRVERAVLSSDAVLRAGQCQIRISARELAVPTPNAGSFGTLVGRSPAMVRLFGLLQRVAPSDATVLLVGETGVGKSAIAREIHAHSARRERPFVSVDCSALVTSLVESELFGHLRGSFTGATSDRSGAFLQAQGGTLCLEDVSSLPLEVQPKLLRFLSEGVVQRVGETRTRTVNVRIIATTQQDLLTQVEAGEFREDLYFRLAVIRLDVPPLRSRRDDLQPLVTRFLEGLGEDPSTLSAEDWAQWEQRPFAGNLRELQNVLSQTVIGLDVAPEETATDPAPMATSSVTSIPYREAKEKILDTFTREYLTELFKETNGNVTEMSKRCGMARTYIHALLNRYQLSGKK